MPLFPEPRKQRQASLWVQDQPSTRLFCVVCSGSARAAQRVPSLHFAPYLPKTKMTFEINILSVVYTFSLSTFLLRILLLFLRQNLVIYPLSSLELVEILLQPPIGCDSTMCYHAWLFANNSALERSFRFDYQNHLAGSFKPQAIFLIISIILYMTCIF